VVELVPPDACAAPGARQLRLRAHRDGDGAPRGRHRPTGEVTPAPMHCTAAGRGGVDHVLQREEDWVRRAAHQQRNWQLSPYLPLKKRVVSICSAKLR
jgi:hypothetical protein